MKHHPPFLGPHLEAIAKVLGDTNSGLTGTEIGNLLAQCCVRDIDPGNTKWIRLYNALVDEQASSGRGNHVVAFIHKALSPVRWIGRGDDFEFLRSEINVALAFAGLRLDEQGELHSAPTATTIRDAEARADRLRKLLRDRSVHEDVLRFCRSELLQENHFHAVLEAVKSIGNKLRCLSGLTSDGAALVDGALALGKTGQPCIAINPLSTDTEEGEQKGFVSLVKGLFGTFRNPTAHAEKIYWPINEQDALDILSVVSLVHRKLDAAHKP